jgi:hypothetical protein
VSARRTAHAWPRAAVVALLVLGQLSLACHQLQHRFAPDLAAPSGDCVLGHLASNLVTGADSMVVLPPAWRVVERRTRVPISDPTSAHSLPSYQSRAPPRVLSV